MKKQEETSELEEEVEEEIESEKLREEVEEIQEDFSPRQFQEFISSGEVVAPVLEQIAFAQQPNLEQEMTSFETTETPEIERGYIPKTETEYISRNPENLETSRTIPTLTSDIDFGVRPFGRQQRFTIDTEADQMRTSQQEKGEYIADVRNVEIERHLPFENPDKRYKERPIR